MLQNYLSVIRKSIGKQPFAMLTNVLSLAIAIACALVAYENYRFYYDFDKQHANHSRIFKINAERLVGDTTELHAVSPLALGPALKAALPAGVTDVFRYQMNMRTLRHEDKSLRERVAFVDLGFMDVFNYELISGVESSFHDRGHVVMTTDAAIAFFGTSDALGRQLQLLKTDGGYQSFIVGGVIEPAQLNMSMRFDVLMNMEVFMAEEQLENTDWGRMVSATFVVGDPKLVSNLGTELSQYIPVQNASRKDWLVNAYYTENITKVGSNARSLKSNRMGVNLHPAQVVGINITAALLLLAACFNFINTSFFLFSRQLKEVSMRKVLGSNRISIVYRFVLENIVISLIAIILGVGIGLYLVELYDSMWTYMNLQLNPLDGGILLYLGVLLLFTSLLGAGYPAFYISGLSPVQILNNRVKLRKQGVLTKVLLASQFVFCLITVIMGLGFSQNGNFLETFNLGFKKDNVFVVPIDNQYFELYQNTIQEHPDVLSTAGSIHHISRNHDEIVAKKGAFEASVARYEVGLGYLRTMGMQVREGRDFDAAMKGSDSKTAVIVNESFVRLFDMDAPIGQQFRINDNLFTIQGVVDEIYEFGMFRPSNPVVLSLANPAEFQKLIVKAREGSAPAMNTYLEDTWYSMISTAPYTGFDQDRFSGVSGRVNDKSTQIFAFLAIIAAFMLIVGMYSLVSINVNKRFKEMGIRKVLGARFIDLFMIIKKDYLLLVLIGSLIGGGAGYLLLNVLLDSMYVIHYSIGLVTVLMPVLLLILVVIGTILSRVSRAALDNPILALRAN